MSGEKISEKQKAPHNQTESGGGERASHETVQATMTMLRATHKNTAHLAKQMDRLTDHFFSSESTPRAREARVLLSQLNQITREQALIVDLVEGLLPMIEEILRRLPVGTEAPLASRSDTKAAAIR